MPNANLCLHAGARHVDRAMLASVDTPAPTRSWAPVSHAHFVNTIEDQLERIGFRFGTQIHGLTKDGARYFGVAELLDGTDDTRAALTVGMRASIDKSMAPSIAFGSCVFVCDNMAFSGEITLTRKQTTYIARDLPLLVRGAVSQVGVMRQHQNDRFDAYQRTPLGKREADELIVDMLRRDIVNPCRLAHLVNEWDNPSRDHGGERTVWRMFNAATEVLKDSPIAQITGRTIALHELCDKVALAA